MDDNDESLPTTTLDDSWKRDLTIKRAKSAIEQGQNIHEVAKRENIDYPSLYAHHAESKLTFPTKILDDPRDALVASQTAIALAASEQLFERVEDGLMSDSDLIKTVKTATANILELKAQPRASGASGISALAQLLESADITLTKRDQAKDAIDVTPVE